MSSNGALNGSLSARPKRNESSQDQDLDLPIKTNVDPHNDVESINDESSYSSEEDDDLILEGVAMRNPDVSSSSDDDDDDDDDDENDQEEQGGTKPTATAQIPATSLAASKKSKAPATTTSTRTKKRKKSKQPEEDLQVEFIFCDMDEKFFDGIKTLLHSSSTVYAPQSSALTDLMIENVSVGTAISTDGDVEGNVFGFASVLNVSTTSSSPAIQHLKDVCLKSCPAQHRTEMETVLSGKTKRPAGFLLQGRMINLPLEIVLVLHQQLVLDMDWAVEHAEGGEDERKSLDFGAFVRLAPCTSGGSASSLFYKYFDDEIFASHAEFSYVVDAPKAYGMEEKQLCQVIVITKTGHRDAIKELSQMVEGT